MRQTRRKKKGERKSDELVTQKKWQANTKPKVNHVDGNIFYNLDFISLTLWQQEGKSGMAWLPQSQANLMTFNEVVGNIFYKMKVCMQVNEERAAQE